MDEGLVFYKNSSLPDFFFFFFNPKSSPKEKSKILSLPTQERVTVTDLLCCSIISNIKWVIQVLTSFKVNFFLFDKDKWEIEKQIPYELSVSALSKQEEIILKQEIYSFFLTCKNSFIPSFFNKLALALLSDTVLEMSRLMQ